MNAIEIRGLTVRYPDAPPPIENLDLTVAQGDVLGVAGESGCGKSTLLLCACGLIPARVEAFVSGDVRLYGRPVGDYARAELAATVGVVFQNPDTQLFCDTVEDEIAFGLENLCMPRREMAARIDEALSIADLARYRTVSPSMLSGGQKQLVVFAAVLAMRPRIWLLDEAFSQVDAPARARLLALVSRLASQGTTMVLVDHEQDNLRVAGRVLRMDRDRAGEG